MAIRNTKKVSVAYVLQKAMKNIHSQILKPCQFGMVMWCVPANFSPVILMANAKLEHEIIIRANGDFNRHQFIVSGYHCVSGKIPSLEVFCSVYKKGIPLSSSESMSWVAPALEVSYCKLKSNTVSDSVGLKPKISKEPQLLYFGTENFELFRVQSI